MGKLERRAIGRVDFSAKGIIVVCDDQSIYQMDVKDLGPIGIGLKGDADMPVLLGKDVVVLVETLIMYADVVRQDRMADGSWSVGVAARKFTPEVLQYLFDGIKLRAELEEM